MRTRMFCRVSYLFWILLLFGCATTTAPAYLERQENSQSFKTVVLGKKVLILPPLISAETTDSEKPVPPESTGAIALANLLENTAKNVSQEAGASSSIAREDVAMQGDLFKGAVQSLTSNGQVLMSYYKDKSVLMANLQTIARATGAEVLCAYSIVVKVGGGGGWDPNSGRIWQGTSSTSVKAVLIDTSTAKILWGNEIFIRTLASDGQCTQAVKQLFIQLKHKET